MKLCRLKIFTVFSSFPYHNLAITPLAWRLPKWLILVCMSVKCVWVGKGLSNEIACNQTTLKYTPALACCTWTISPDMHFSCAICKQLAPQRIQSPIMFQDAGGSWNGSGNWICCLCIVRIALHAKSYNYAHADQEKTLTNFAMRKAIEIFWRSECPFKENCI